MGVKRLEDLVALKAAVAFEEEVQAIVRAHPGVQHDRTYRDRVFDALASIKGNIAEGWGRRGAGQMCLFLGHAVGSVDEPRRRLIDGVVRGYFSLAACEKALQHAHHCGGATVNLKRSQEPFIPRRPTRKRRGATD